MATQARLTKLDSDGVNAFMNGPLAEFIAALHDLGIDSNGTLSPRSIARGYTNPDTFPLTKPLGIGLMAGGDTVHGSTLNTTTLKFTQSIDQIIQGLTDLSQEVKDSLTKMVNEFLKKQGDTLSDIKAADFLNLIKSATGTGTNGPNGLPNPSQTTTT
ncbi:type VII secretion system-associated protein [Streptomyces sp. NPDC048297]|uniref:type VII secretion system-associated protein n=1 Tax=Streptomyces sp. NPDC048297 TaxID=3365531 RepID=UPI00370F96FA